MQDKQNGVTFRSSKNNIRFEVHKFFTMFRGSLQQKVVSQRRQDMIAYPTHQPTNGVRLMPRPNLDSKSQLFSVQMETEWRKGVREYSKEDLQDHSKGKKSRSFDIQVETGRFQESGGSRRTEDVKFQIVYKSPPLVDIEIPSRGGNHPETKDSIVL